MFLFFRNYVRDSRGRLKNVPYVDNSYKWAGGGYLSTVKDLSVFGNTMLKCYQGQANGKWSQWDNFIWWLLLLNVIESMRVQIRINCARSGASLFFIDFTFID